MKTPRARGGYYYLASLAITVLVLALALILQSYNVPGMAFVALGSLVALALLIKF